MTEFKPTNYVVYREIGKLDDRVAAFDVLDNAELFLEAILNVDGNAARDNYFITDTGGLRLCEQCGTYGDNEGMLCPPCLSEAAYGAEMDRRIDIARGK